MQKSVFLEAVIVGIGLVVVGMLIHIIACNFKKHDMNDNTVLAYHFFIAGFIVHLLCEYFEINKWYCKNGVACST
jgi:hypothetical protein